MQIAQVMAGYSLGDADLLRRAMGKKIRSEMEKQRAIFVDEKDPHDPAKKVHVFKGFEQTKPGSLNKADYDLAMADLVAFLQWIGEPAQTQRARMGVWVLLFLAVFTLIAWRLNASYWKDIK